MQLAYFDTSQEIENNFIIFPKGAFGGAFPNGFIGNPEVWERQSRFNFSGFYTGLKEHAIRIGAGYHLSDMYKTKETKNFGLDASGNPIDPSGPLIDVSDSPFVFLKETDRTNQYLYIQDIWNIANDWELTAGLRYDNYSDFGSTVNPRLALVLSTTFNLSTKLLYGKAFHAPSFADIGNINNPVALGNPNIQPEQMETVELAFDYHPHSDITGTLNFYRYEWSDIILFVPDEGQPSSTAQNVGKQTGYGVETEIKWEIQPSLNLLANATWSNATNNNTNEDAAFVPNSQYYLQLDWKATESLNVNVKTNWIKDRKRSTLDIRNEVDNYVLTDATIRWRPENQVFQISLLAKNIFDVDAREPSLNNGEIVNIPNDLPLAGRSLLAEVRYHF